MVIDVEALLPGRRWFTPSSPVAAAYAVKALGCDYMDVTSGQVDARQKIPFGPSFNVPFSAKARKESGIPTMAVGLITGYREAEDIVASGKADMVALARGAMYDPRWPLHAGRPGSRPPGAVFAGG